MLDQIKGKHLLVDGDIYAYRCAASAEKTKYLIEDGTGSNVEFFDYYKDALLRSKDRPSVIWNRKEIQPLEFALQACKTAIDSLLTKLSPSKVSMFLSPDRTFRHDLARTKPYKGNRNHVPKPKYLKEVKEYLIREYGATVANNIEADDEIGIHLSGDADGAVSVSIDKDLLQIPGWHYNWVTDRVQRITPRMGDFQFYTQMLTGDVTDNIPGCPGTGIEGAKKILTGAKSRADLESRVWSCYRGEFNDSDKARSYYLEQAQLLWILRGKGEDAKGNWRSGQYTCETELK